MLKSFVTKTMPGILWATTCLSPDDSENILSEAKIDYNDASLSCAMFINDEPFFTIKTQVQYEFDFSSFEIFTTSLQTLMSLALNQIEKVFVTEHVYILVLLNQLCQEDKYSRLQISSLRRIVIRNGTADSIILTNADQIINRSLVYDLGTVARTLVNR